MLLYITKFNIFNQYIYIYIYIYIYVCVCVCIYIYIYIYIDSYFFKEEGHHSNLQKVPMRTHVNPLDKFILAIPVEYGTSIRTVFGVDSTPLYSYMASHTCCYGLKYIVTKLAQITSLRLKKDLGKISQWLFAVMISYMTSHFGFEQRDPITNMFRLRSVLLRFHQLVK